MGCEKINIIVIMFIERKFKMSKKNVFKIFYIIIMIAILIVPGIKKYIYNNFTLGVGSSNGSKYYCSYFKKTESTYEKESMVNFISNDGINMIKRINGVPGDTVDIEEKRILINDEVVRDRSNNVKVYEPAHYELGEDEYFMLGDSILSWDSAFFGPVKEEQFIKQVEFYKKAKSDDLDVKILNYFFVTGAGKTVEEVCDGNKK